MVIAAQGPWTEDQYLKLDTHGLLLEYSDGAIEALPMPTRKHQAILRFMLFALFAFIEPLRGTALSAPLRLRIGAAKFREPDILLLLDADDPRGREDFWSGADLVVEIVSPDDPERDTIVKRAEYAAADIPEYWIINPLDQTVTVLQLEAQSYTAHGIFRPGANATSALLDGFSVDVHTLFSAR